MSYFDGEPKWRTYLPAPTRMLLSKDLIMCEYANGNATLTVDAPNKGCSIGANGGLLSESTTAKLCTFVGEPMKRTPSHCFVACP